jgi:hypothetical protein
VSCFKNKGSEMRSVMGPTPGDRVVVSGFFVP